jgi:hypothetical protein
MSARKTPAVKKVRGLLLTPSGAATPIEVENSVRALWDVVGGDVERVPLKNGADLFANRESRGLPSRRNRLADDLIQNYGKRPTRLVVVGDALVLGEVQPSGTSTDVPDWVSEYLTQRAE